MKFATKPIWRYPPRLPTVHKVWKSVNIWQSYSEFKGRNFFFETQCRYEYSNSFDINNRLNYSNNT